MQEKKKFINVFKLRCLTMASILFILSCKSEGDNDNIEHQLPDISKIDLSHNAELNTILNNTARNTSKKSILEEIDFEKAIKYIDSSGITSYSLPIGSEFISKDFYNLNIIKQAENKYNIFILKYEPDYQFLKDNNFDISKSVFQGTIKHYDLNYNLLFESSTHSEHKTDNHNYQHRGDGCSPYWESTSACSGIPWDCGGSICGFNTTFHACIEPGESQGGTGTPSTDSNTPYVNVGGGSSGGGYSYNSTPEENNDVTPNSPSYTPAELALVEINECLNLSPGTSMWLSQQVSSSTKNDIFITQIRDFLKNDNCSESAKNASNITIASAMADKLEGVYDNNYFLTIDPYVDADLSNPYLQAIWMSHFSTKCAVLKLQNPKWSMLKVYWEATKEMVHIALDIGGMTPVIGEVCDLTNGFIYTLEGDGLNATLSFAAAIPIGGWFVTGAKYATKIKATTLGTKIRLTWEILQNGFVYFGSSGSKLRKVLGITDSALHAHHLIPWAQVIRNHSIIQKAAKSKHAFHMNEALNGIPVAAWRNRPNHSLYNHLIKSKLDDFNNLYPNANTDEAYTFVSDLIGDIRNWVINNPNSHLNELVLP